MKNKLVTPTKIRHFFYALLAAVDFFFARFEWYRELCGGVWMHVCIVRNAPYLPTVKNIEITKWVRDRWESKEKYWVMGKEIYCS
jgi:hypothetical protein